VKQYVLALGACLFLGCESAPPGPPPEPDHLAADIAQLNADLLACMRRENDRLREEKAELDARINAAIVEATVLATKPTKPRPR
jgi:hypothetical protein